MEFTIAIASMVVQLKLIFLKISKISHRKRVGGFNFSNIGLHVSTRTKQLLQIYFYFLIRSIQFMNSYTEEYTKDIYCHTIGVL